MNELTLLEAVLDAWERNNTVLVNLVQALPEHGLGARASESSPTVSEMFTHMHHERMVSLLENVPELAGPVPEKEWTFESDKHRIAQILTESAYAVKRAVESRIASGRNLDLDFDHPIQLLQFLIFHEGYHHGQIKLALKRAGCPIPDSEAGPLMWAVWRARK